MTSTIARGFAALACLSALAACQHTHQPAAAISFDPGFYLEDGAIDAGSRRLDLSKIHFHALPSVDLQSMEIRATVRARTGSDNLLIATFNCLSGPALKNVRSSVQGTACNYAPKTILIPAGAVLEADMHVYLEGVMPPVLRVGQGYPPKI